MQRYRSGHNGADSKSVCEQSHMGSNPILSATPAVGNSPAAVFLFISHSTILILQQKTPAVGNSPVAVFLFISHPTILILQQKTHLRWAIRISQFIHRLRIKHNKKTRKLGRAVTPHKPSFFTVYTEKTVIILFHYYNIEVFLLSLCRIRLRERGMSIYMPYNECNYPATLAYRR